jgi:hypothetical protein
VKPGIHVTASGIAASGDVDVLAADVVEVVVFVLEPVVLLDELHAASSVTDPRRTETIRRRG